ncbi:phospholipid/cholesterol/gamma-HCH transport system substrate-binding protein [Actinocorallia herbida]|uniref:Phospholipid/cholesterol/gamma-HCH transport system substrate-binding protein n=1 Tax=Actinocorallia herbida TaxID=58109 RepID=A0A3N1D3X3_9ACTN|nr:MCE family protein [Actinocorallia herbida]ROO88231.1 phospholipid/cholesterol/gamma-HCH transport system substrate-binding protein [Actinocorallia herbida]
MRPRILINLVSFVVLGVVLMVWALTSIVTVDALRRPFTVEAEFASSPGLRTDLEVAYLGVRVGSVDSVRLEEGKVVVAMHLNRGVEVPSNSGAAVLRKSAIGEPYIEINPPPSSPARSLQEGDVIPLDRTEVAVEYKRLFDGAGDLLAAVEPEDAQTLVHELATGLEGRDTTIRDLLGDAHQLTGTLADNAETLDSLSEELTELTGILADGGPELASGLDGLAAATGALSDRREELNSILEKGPSFLRQVDALLKESRPGLSCLLTALGTPSPPLFTPQSSKNLGHALGLMTDRFPKIVDEVIEKGPGGDYARVTMVITGGGPVPAAKEYSKPAAGPKTPRLYYCTKAYKADDLDAKTAAPDTGKTTGRPVATGPFTSVEVPDKAQAKPASESSAAGRWLTLIPIILAAVILAVTARRTLRVVRRRGGR